MKKEIEKVSPLQVKVRFLGNGIIFSLKKIFFSGNANTCKAKKD